VPVGVSVGLVWRARTDEEVLCSCEHLQVSLGKPDRKQEEEEQEEPGLGSELWIF
jgi:hypothetical protein